MSENNTQSANSIVRPYGDRLDDGMVQLSFTLPTKAGPEAREAAIQLVEKMGFEKIAVSHMEAIAESFTFFVVYGKCTHSVDMSQIQVTKLDNPYLNYDQINEFIRDKIGRKLVVVGACIGSDAHTVGIDAIFNMKGFAHDWGFERYPWMSAHNLRAQVAAEDLVEKLVELRADAVLISRVVTQRDEHITELKNFLELLKNRQGILPHLIKICGGPRLTHQDAVNLGYDAGFGPGTKPSEVGSFIVHEFHKRCPELYIPPLPVKPEPVKASEQPDENTATTQWIDDNFIAEEDPFSEDEGEDLTSSGAPDSPDESERSGQTEAADSSSNATQENKPADESSRDRQRPPRGGRSRRHPWRRRDGGRDNNERGERPEGAVERPEEGAPAQGERAERPARPERSESGDRPRRGGRGRRGRGYRGGRRNDSQRSGEGGNNNGGGGGGSGNGNGGGGGGES